MVSEAIEHGITRLEDPALRHILQPEAPVQNSYSLALGEIQTWTFSVSFSWQPSMAVACAAQTRTTHALVGNTSRRSLRLTPAQT